MFPPSFEPTVLLHVHQSTGPPARLEVDSASFPSFDHHGPTPFSSTIHQLPLTGHVLDNLNSPFGMLAGYIFGGNTQRGGAAAEKVAMTSPVLMTQAPGAAEKVAMTAPVLMTSNQQPSSDKALKTMVRGMGKVMMNSQPNICSGEGLGVMNLQPGGRPQSHGECCGSEVMRSIIPGWPIQSLGG